MLKKGLILIIVNLLVVLVFFGESVLGQPSITGAPGSISHKDSIIITGSSFGNKSPAAPLMWDNAEDDTHGGSITLNDPDAITNFGYVDVWKNNKVTIGQLMQAIGEWKDGC